MRQYFCQCFSHLLVNDLKLIPPSNAKNLPTPLHNFFFFFQRFNLLLFVKDLKLDFSTLNRKKLPTPLIYNALRGTAGDKEFDITVQMILAARSSSEIQENRNGR